MAAERVPAAQSELVILPIAKLKEHPKNPRTTFDEHKLAELESSIRAQGVLVPLLVRKQGAGFEIIGGARRFRASKRAGLEHVPAIVRELDDDLALELLILDNLQRDDLSVLEEAEGYRQLMLTKRYDVDKIAAKVGRSAKYVYDRVKLLQLTPAARQHLVKGEITAGHAILLARLSAKDQARALEDGTFAHEQLLWDPIEDTKNGVARERRGPGKPVSVRELSDWIDKNVRFDAKAPDPMLFPETVTALQEAPKVVPITYLHYIPDEARDGKVRTFFPQSWKRADGQLKSKKCAFAVMGFVAAGPRRGEAFEVCVNKDKCETHWGPEIRARRRRAASGSSAKRSNVEASAPKRDPKLEEALRKAEQAAHDRVDQLVLAKAAAMSPADVLRVVAGSRAWCVRSYLQDTKGKLGSGRDAAAAWAAKAPIVEVQKALIHGELRDGYDDDLAQQFGVDPSKILKEAEAAARAELKAQTSAPKASKAKRAKKGGKK